MDPRRYQYSCCRMHYYLVESMLCIKDLEYRKNIVMSSFIWTGTFSRPSIGRVQTTVNSGIFSM